MKIVLQSELAKDQSLKEKVAAATPDLEREIGELASEVTATWSIRTGDDGRRLLHLELADWAGEAGADFTVEELQQPENARWRFYRLWGDLLQKALRSRVKSLETALVED